MFWAAFSFGMALGLYLGFQAYKKYLDFKWGKSINSKKQSNESNPLYVAYRANTKRDGTEGGSSNSTTGKEGVGS